MKKENGFWTAFILIFLTTMASMGLGAALLIRNEAMSVEKQFSSLQTDYAAIAGARYALARMQLGDLEEGTTFYIGGTSVLMDSSMNEDGKTVIDVYSTTTGSLDPITSHMSVLMDGPWNVEDKAIFSIGNTSWLIDVRDEDRVSNDWYNFDGDAQEDDSIPVINTTALLAYAINQDASHEITVNYTIPADFPTGATDFYGSYGGYVQPHVFYVNGDLTVNHGLTAYGIYWVTGDVILNGRAKIMGVVYQGNSSSEVIFNETSGNEPRITGGVITAGRVKGDGLFDGGYVNHDRDYMKTFCDLFRQFPDAPPVLEFERWEYAEGN